VAVVLTETVHKRRHGWRIDGFVNPDEVTSFHPGQAFWRPHEPEDIHFATIPEEGDFAPTTWGAPPQKRNADGELMWDAMDPTVPVLDWPM